MLTKIKNSSIVDGTITSNSNSFTVTLVPGVTTEGSKTYALWIRTDSTSGTVVATTSNITINDTSLAPVYIGFFLIMFILNFLPSWFFPLLAVIALLLFLISRFISLPQAQLVYYLSIIIFALSLFMCGANFNNDYWLTKIKEVEIKLAQAEAQSAQENTKIVEKVVTRREIVRLQGNDIVKYTTKLPSSCIIKSAVEDEILFSHKP